MMRYHFNRLLVSSAVLITSHAEALGGLTLNAGSRTADFRLFSGAKGTGSVTGTDFTAGIYLDGPKNLPVIFGISSSQQSYQMSHEQDPFQSIKVSELGPEAGIKLNFKKIALRTSINLTALGRLDASTTKATTMQTGAGTTNYQATSRYQANLSGLHFDTSALYSMPYFGAGIGVDIGLLRSRVKKIEVDRQDVTDQYRPYILRDSSFNSTAVFITLQVQL